MSDGLDPSKGTTVPIYVYSAMIDFLHNTIDYYGVLGVNSNASQEQLKAAYVQLGRYKY
jgi:hypothetical protein